ncbi:hypothetical protein [Fusobacterium gastrosuis]|uniref:hypothetical protein n=1 Tax=Fusobacterium gastrosuis TaxID=1755100 RepID=UPI002979A2CF|nr:hypothetical protein [Fusobacteriaceae bacterium]MDY5305399.1 hypothetical protein [Fusobacterium gastrosuis]MDY5713855.1 hypothetical protein [Fusobacterium gastrosuis]
MFVLNKKRKQSGRSTDVIRIRLTTLEIVEELAEESGHSKQEIMDRAIKYAYENLQWEEE